LNYLASVPWLVILGWLGTNILAYLIGRQTRIDQIKLQTKQTLAEEMAVLLRDDYQKCVYLRQLYKNNFHRLTLSEAAAAFDKHKSLYGTDWQMIVELHNSMGKLQSVNRHAWGVFFAESHKMHRPLRI
jgi:hypothetical protein